MAVALLPMTPLDALYERYCRFCRERGIRPADFNTWLLETLKIPDAR